MIIKYFAWLKNITEKEEEVLFDDSIKNITVSDISKLAQELLEIS